MISDFNNPMYVKWKYQNPPAFHSFWFEKLNYDAWKSYAAQNWALSFYASASYLALIFSLKHIMKNRPPFQLKWELIIWNLCLGAFSLVGFLRIGQELVHVLKLPGGFHKSICSRVGLNPPAAFYSVAFALSKFVELGDTVFIVLRKKPLIFLQWYHHCSSLILAWQVLPLSEPIFRWLGFANMAIHFLMYNFFALQVMNYRMSRKIAMFITTLQLAQMLIGVGLNVYSIHVIGGEGHEACARDPISIKWIGAVYASFLILFAQFFYERYISAKSKSKIS